MIDLRADHKRCLNIRKQGTKKTSQCKLGTALSPAQTSNSFTASWTLGISKCRDEACGGEDGLIGEVVVGIFFFSSFVLIVTALAGVMTGTAVPAPVLAAALTRQEVAALVFLRRRRAFGAPLDHPLLDELLHLVVVLPVLLLPLLVPIASFIVVEACLARHTPN